MERDPVKILIAAILTLYFLWCAYSPLNAVFMHLVNLPIHEAGHVFFAPFGRFVGVAGGSLLQIIVPLVFFGYFYWREQPFSASVVLLWVGQSIVDVSVYAADAVVMQLPLLSGVTGSEGGFHDWNYLLAETGLLKHTTLVSGLMRFFGTAVIIFGSVGAFLYAVKGEKIFTDLED